MFDVGIDLVPTADFLKHVNDAFIGSAMERTLESCDRCGNLRVNICQCRYRDPSAESRGIHPVLGMQYVSDVKRLCLFLRRDFPIQQIEKMRGLAEILSNRWEIQVVTDSVKVRADHSNLGGDTSRSASRSLQAIVDRDRRIVESQHRNRCGKNIYRQCRFGS